MLTGMSVTTIRVDTGIRDQLSKIAKGDFGGASLNAALERLIAEHEMRQAQEAYERLRADPEAWAEYLEEIRLWDVTADDGLGDAREEYPEYNQ